METNKQKENLALQRKVVCVALAAAFTGPVLAEDDEVARLVKPESSISLGAGYVTRDSQRFGQYNGLDQEGAVGLADFSVVRRNDETGIWFRANGRNLGLSTRELRVEHERQGDWGYFIDFNQIPRVAPYDIRTSVTGLNTAQQTVPAVSTPGTSSYTFRTERQMTKLGFSKSILPELDFRLVFQNEEKEGKRLFGRGNGAVQEFLAEPIKSTTRQVDAVLDYTGDKLQLSGGYYGSFYENHNSYLSVAGGNAAAFTVGAATTNVSFDRIALPPDNSAHQFHLAGGYQFTNTTRGSFKVSKARAIQNDSFMPVVFGANGASANTSGRSDLGGEIDTTLVQLGLTSRPIKNLSLLANVRYEDRDDRTAVARYITGLGGTAAVPTIAALGATSTTDGFNEPRSLTNTSGKFEASYLLPEGFRVIGGLDADIKERSMAGVRVVGYRERTQENTWRAEVKRTMAESLTGGLAYLHSERTGSDYRDLRTLGGFAYPTYGSNNVSCAAPVTLGGGANTITNATRCGLLQPIFMADRDRDRIRLTLDWAPTDSLSAQLVLEGSQDDYGRGRGNPDIGVRKGDSHTYTLDLSYALTDNWKLTGWTSLAENSINQATIASPTSAAIAVWSADIKNLVESYALGVRGKLLGARLDVGADYVYAHDLTRYKLGREFGTTAVNSLPDITWKQSTIKFFGKYAVDKDWALRFDYIFDHRKTDDWTWSGWSYTDGTVVSQRPDQKVQFFGLSANYTFR